ncbi:MAG: phosphatase PAP2 family protein [Anaerolineae bacterium]|nr:phosphatase PAP2 family protein [Anaerolineae bacterium]MDW8100370.1 phosphatase PAP2 family protein [Anaerolineae bacterium]
MHDWLASWIPAGTAFILAVQRWSNPFLDQLFLTATYLGVDTFLVFLVAFIFWCVDRRIGLNLAYLLLTCDSLNSFLKNVFRLPRPAADGLRILRPETSPGFPSGHAQDGVAVWGYLATRIRQPIAWLLAVLIIALVAFSRIYIGVHFPQDVVGGLLIGVAFLIAYLFLAPRLGAWLARQTVSLQVALAILIPLALWLIHPAEQHTLAGETTLSYPSGTMAGNMGFLIGISLGFLAEQRFVRFRVGGPWWQRLLRLALGAAIVLFFWQGLKAFIPDGLSAVWIATLRLIRYTLAGMAAAWWAPWLFVRLGLAERQR